MTPLTTPTRGCSQSTAKRRVHGVRRLFAAACAGAAAAVQAQTPPPLPASAPAPRITKSLPDKPLLLRDGPSPLTRSQTPPAAPPPPPPPAPAPAPAPAPPAIPAIKASVAMPDQAQFIASGAHAQALFWSQSVMIQNGIRLTAANPAYLGVKPLNAAAFPNGSFNVVVTGGLTEYSGKSLTLASGSQSVTCPLAQAPAAWRCVITLPVGVIGQQQQVSMTTNTTTLLAAISVE